jgi:hypothetical protein
MGPFRWLTVNSPEGAQAVEPVLEPMTFPPAQTYQKALFDAGIPPPPCPEDILAKFARREERGAIFHGESKSVGQLFPWFLRSVVA